MIGINPYCERESMSTQPIRLGGMLRCCVESVQRYDGPESPGVTEIPCEFHDQDKPTARLASDSTWEWVGMPNQSER